MAFNVSEFITQANGMNGIGRRTHFKMTFNLPTSLSKYSRMLPLVTVSSNVPRIAALTRQVRRATTSFEESFPYNVQFGDLSCSFLSDGNGQVLSLFNEWMNIIYPVSPDDIDRFRVPYRNEYVAPTATLEHYDPQGNLILTYTFYNVYPESISDVSFSWAAYDDIIQLPVEFKYSYFTIKQNTVPKSNSDVIAQQPAQRTALPVTPKQ